MGNCKNHRSYFARLLITLLLGILGLALYFSLNPPALAAVLRAAPIPGSVPIPTPGPTPPLPVIAASPGPLPTGYQAYAGAFAGGLISCGFLLDLGDNTRARGARVGVTAAHASPRLPPGEPAEFRLPDSSRVALLPAQIAFGETFIGGQLTMDYALWSVDPAVDPDRFLSPDPRPLAQPGEPVYLYAPVADAAGGPLRWPGTVVSAAPDAIWVQLEDSFSPVGYSGCPVVSRVTGKLIGMALAGADMPAAGAGVQGMPAGGPSVVIGLHPVASLVEKVRAELHLP
jgi:hypothetical protein